MAKRRRNRRKSHSKTKSNNKKVEKNKNGNGSSSKPEQSNEDNGLYGERTGSSDEDRTRARRRKQDLNFIIFLVIITIIFGAGFYYYFIYDEPGENGTNGVENDINGNVDGDTENNEIVWELFDNGLELAESQNKPIMIDFYYDDCYWCQELDKNTYTDQRVIDKSKEFVNIKVDLYEKVAYDGNQLTNQYQVTGFPTIVFLYPNGNEIKRIEGYLDPGPFLEDMDYVLSIT